MRTPRQVGAVNRLERFNAERDEIVATVERRVIDRHVAAAAAGGDASLEYVLNEVAFSEIRRLEGNGDRRSHKKMHRWRELANRLGRMAEPDKRAELETMVHRFATDVVGKFDPRVYRIASDVLPPALSVLFSPVSSLREGVRALGGLGRRIEVEGPLTRIRTAASRGTLVITPTHSSNLDSMVLGLGLVQARLPPVTYGAGKNLFSNPLISFFMYNLGAYRVDRRLKFSLYKDVLKEYSTVLLERGYHSLFFPGGTRSRSNQVEQRLKLGLLGTALTAYENNLLAGDAHRRIYVVPVTINYRLVLEAETLIDDYLSETGRSRYIIEDDEFSRLGRIAEFTRKIVAHEGSVVLRFGDPLDLFGNDIDDEGESIDRRGRRVDPGRYLEGAGGGVSLDRQRDAEYTRELGRRVARAFHRDILFLSTHLLSRAAFDLIAAQVGTRDIYRLLRVPPAMQQVSIADTLAGIDRLREAIARAPECGAVHARLQDMPADEIAADAVHALQAYHTRPVVERGADILRIGAMKLLYYYGNRTSHVPVEGPA